MQGRAKKLVRKVLGGKVLRAVEDEYRLARASFVNARFNWPARGMRVIMVTGTNGKTTTAHFLFSILRAAGYSVGLSSTAELRIDEQVEINATNMTVVDPGKLQQQLARFKAHRVDFVILEATSQSLDQHRLWGVPCEVAVFTNLTQDHLDYHKTMERYAAAKAKLWQLKPKLSVLNADDDWFDYFAKRATGRLLTYGQKDGEITFSDYQLRQGKARFILHLPSGKQVITSQLPGLYNAYNATAAATVATGLKVSPEAIEAGIEALAGVAGRLEKVALNRSYTVVVDYAHTPDGLKKALVAARELTNKKLWLVFGACGDRDKAKRPLMGTLAARLADHIVVTDEESYSEDPLQIQAAIIHGIKKVKGGAGKLQHIPERGEAIATALAQAKPGDLILITGLGHEQYRIQNGQRIAWSDVEMVKKLAKK